MTEIESPPHKVRKNKRRSSAKGLIDPPDVRNPISINDPLNLSGVEDSSSLPKALSPAKSLTELDATIEIATNDVFFSESDPLGLNSPTQQLTSPRFRKGNKRQNKAKSTTVKHQQLNEKELPVSTQSSDLLLSPPPSKRPRTESIFELDIGLESVVSTSLKTEVKPGPTDTACAAVQRKSGPPLTLTQGSGLMSPSQRKRHAKSHKSVYRQQSSLMSPISETGKKKPKNAAKFRYGNYNRYYGYRNQYSAHDVRLDCVQVEWFVEQDVLDIGCNIGHISLTVARDYHPKHVTGIDIDPYLISIARKNIKHYVEVKIPQAVTEHSESVPADFTEDRSVIFHHPAHLIDFHTANSSPYPYSPLLMPPPLPPPQLNQANSRLETHEEHSSNLSNSNLNSYVPTRHLERMYGPLPHAHVLNTFCSSKSSTTSVTEKPRSSGFPNNISFVTANFVPMSDAELQNDKPLYDTILCLSVTKWLHLNFGDEGLKRSFKRMYLQLRPGGRLLLEPQQWPSYRKKHKLFGDEMKAVYDSIQFRPKQFVDYLTSAEVGFASCDLIATPTVKNKPGFSRPIYLLLKRLLPT